jgi:hypothetical protein
VSMLGVTCSTSAGLQQAMAHRPALPGAAKDRRSLISAKPAFALVRHRVPPRTGRNLPWHRWREYPPLA